MNPRAFSLIEILVSISVIAVLIALFYPYLKNTRRAANDMVCRTNLREVFKAAILYSSDRAGMLPDMVDWRSDRPEVLETSMIPYLYGNVEVGSIGIRNSFLSCPVAQSDPYYQTDTTDERPRYDYLNGTYGINVYMHGSNRSGGSISNYEEWKDKNPVAWNIASVLKPGSTPFFMDGACLPNLNAVRYSVYQSSARVKQATLSSGVWSTPFLHPDKGVQIVFVDGHIETLTREKLLELDWSGRE